MCYYKLQSQPNTLEIKFLSRLTVCNLTKEERLETKVEAEMVALDLSTNNCLVTASIEENDEDEGVFIDEPMIYEDLSDHDPANAEPIEEEALMPDVKDFEFMDSYDQYI